MRDTLRRLRSDALIYGFGQALGRGVQFLLVPILTRLLTPDVYGVSDLVLAYSQFVVLVLVFGTDAALVRFFYGEPDREARRRMISTSFVFRVVLGLAASLAFSLAAGAIAHDFLGSDVYRKYVAIAPAASENASEAASPRTTRNTNEVEIMRRRASRSGSP